MPNPSQPTGERDGGARSSPRDRRTDAAVRDAAERIEALRALRARRDRDVSIGGLIASVETEATRRRGQLGDLVEVWEAHVPASLAQRATISGLRGTVLDVTVESSADAYELNCLLRAGLLAQLRRGCRRTLARVRVSVGPVERSESRER